MQFNSDRFKRKEKKCFAGGGRSDLPFWKNIVAGGSAGAIEILIMYPTG